MKSSWGYVDGSGFHRNLRACVMQPRVPANDRANREVPGCELGKTGLARGVVRVRTGRRMAVSPDRVWTSEPLGLNHPDANRQHPDRFAARAVPVVGPDPRDSFGDGILGVAARSHALVGQGPAGVVDHFSHSGAFAPERPDGARLFD